MDLTNKVSIITGASGGLGRIFCKHLAEAGAHVVINYKSNKNKAQEIYNIVTSLGRNALIVQGDISSEADAVNLAKRTFEKFGKIDILINNAGISVDAPSWKMSGKVWDKVIRTNLYGTFNATKAVLPTMRKKESGRIINISSVAGSLGVFGTSAYSSSKAGIFGFTRTVAIEVVKKGITVNAVALGYFDAGMFHSLNPDIRETIIKKIPIGKPGNPDHLAEFIIFLASDSANYITGQVIYIDGGVCL